MLLVLITFTLITIGVVSFFAGAWMISRYGFRVSTGTGVGVLLFPPYTFWFAFFQLEQEGKELPIATWLFGLVSTILLVFVFWAPLNLVATQGFAAAIESSESPGEAAIAEYGDKSDEIVEDDEAPAEEEPAEPAPAATTANADAGATGADAAANNGTTANAGTTGAAAPAAAE